jgi:hypothetical protein
MKYVVFIQKRVWICVAKWKSKPLIRGLQFKKKMIGKMFASCKYVLKLK